MSKIAKAAFGLMIVTILSKIIGFAREQVLAYYYGTSNYAAAYFTALNIPTVIFASLGSAISTSLVPMYTSIQSEKSELEADKFINNIIGIVFILCSVILIIGLIFTDPIVKLFAVGFEKETFNLSVQFTKILFWGILFTGISNVMIGYLQVKGNFNIPGLISLPSSIIIIISIILSAKYGVYVLVYGTLIGTISQLIFQLPFAYKKGFRYKPILSFKDENIKKLMILVIPVLIGVSVNQFNNMIDRSLASTLGPSIVASFSYANKLYYFVQGLFIASIVTVMYPKLSYLLSSKDILGFKESLIKTMNTIILLIIPITIGTIVFSEPVVKLVFERGAFTYKATIVTSTILSLYAIGMVAFGLNDIISRAFYSLKDTKTPMINGAIVMVVNIILNITLIKLMGYAGLAIASSISAFVGLIIFIISLRKRIGDIGLGAVNLVFIKSLIAATIMGVASKWIYSISYNAIGSNTVSQIISLTISVGIGAIVYGLILLLLKTKELTDIVNIIKSKINKK